MIGRRLLLLMPLLFAAPALAADGYGTPKGTCDGWPRAPIGMAKGYCAGFVVRPPEDFTKREMQMPRYILPMPGGRDFLITDMRTWGSRDGMVWRLRIGRDGKTTEVTQLLSGLALVNGIGRGPDGKVYVGELGRIFRFDPSAMNPASTIQPVVTGMPNGRGRDYYHPQTVFIFDADGSLIVNAGSTSDRCVRNDKTDGTTVCNQSEGTEPTAGIRRYQYKSNGVWDSNATIFARGLRNSMALARHSSGTLLQSENSVDFPEAYGPYEELNLLRAGAHYGWPYCVNMNSAVPEWANNKAMDCKSSAHTPPIRLLPPHSAPLAMLYYDGAMFPELKGKLLLNEHGYRPAGARLVAFTVDAKGVPVLTPRARYPFVDNESKPAKSGTRPYEGPASVPLQLTPDWHEVKDLRPTGTPLGLAVAEDGAIWVVEDKNGTILRIAKDRP